MTTALVLSAFLAVGLGVLGAVAALYVLWLLLLVGRGIEDVLSKR